MSSAGLDMKRSVAGKKVVVCGIGASGFAAARLLRRMGAAVTASDLRMDDGVRENVGRLRESGVDCRIGTQGADLLRGMDMVVLSPGVRGESPLMRAALKTGIEVVGEIELASWFWPGPVVAVTGTNGKTTTACMLKAALDAAGRNSVLSGNIGYPFSLAVLEHGDADLAVLEVSSFQLEHVRLFHPDVAVLLNLAPDHLDRYRGAKEYYAVKLRVFSNQKGGDLAVFRWDERESVLPVAGGTGAETMTFGLNGCRMTVRGDDVVLDGEKIFSLSGFALPGAHNIENALAASAAALACGVEKRAIEGAIRSFPGLPHRIEFLGTFRGVSFYNDSKATNLDAMLKALRSVAGPVLLIAGGKEKGEDYASAGEAVCEKVRAVFLIGESAGAMGKAFSGCCDVAMCADLDAAVSAAASSAGRGDTVLLSPGCSSLDMYRSFEERGDHFKRIVMNLRGGEDE